MSAPIETRRSRHDRPPVVRAVLRGVMTRRSAIGRGWHAGLHRRLSPDLVAVVRKAGCCGPETVAPGRRDVAPESTKPTRTGAGWLPDAATLPRGQRNRPEPGRAGSRTPRRCPGVNETDPNRRLWTATAQIVDRGSAAGRLGPTSMPEPAGSLTGGHQPDQFGTLPRLERSRTLTVGQRSVVTRQRAS